MQRTWREEESWELKEFLLKKFSIDIKLNKVNISSQQQI